MARMNSDQLAQQFIERGLTAQQGRLLTAKQAQFLFSLAREEAERAGHYGPFRAINGAPEISGQGWTLYIMKNGAGSLKASEPAPPAPVADTSAAPAIAAFAAAARIASASNASERAAAEAAFAAACADFAQAR